nr:retrovirus-related Pol polyprotein from transposon TNT 1-94 [Tanacetum cinerariifolium]
MKIRRINASSAQETRKINSRYSVPLFTNTPYARLFISQRYAFKVIDGLRKKNHLSLKNDMPLRDKVNMDDPNITIEEYIRLEEEKARRNGKVYNWETATYDSKNDNDKVNMPLFSSPELEVSYFDDLDFLKDFEKEFPAIVYNDALTSKSDFSTDTLCPQHVDSFNLKNETLSEYMNNDNGEIDIEQPSGDMSIIPLPNPISLLNYTSTLTSVNEYVFVLSGGVVDWKSAKQSTTVMSSTEAGYIAAAKASMKAVWMRKFIDGLGNVVPSNKRPMEMLCDNELAIAIANDTRILKGSKHF